MADLEIRGLDKLMRKLNNLADVHRVLEPPMHRAVLRVQNRMANYPPAPPRSTYRRTGSYGRKWTTRVERTTNGLIGKAGNNIEYAPWVGSKRFQRPIHRRTGWPTDEDVLQQELPAITADFNRAVADALKK